MHLQNQPPLIRLNIMHNKFIYLSGILTILIISCSNYHRTSRTTDCETFLKSENLYFDSTKDVAKYVEDVSKKISDINQKDLKKIYCNCTKPEIIQHFLKKHPQIDSVTITPSGHGISFFRKDKLVWSNIIIN